MERRRWTIDLCPASGQPDECGCAASGCEGSDLVEVVRASYTDKDVERFSALVLEHGRLERDGVLYDLEAGVRAALDAFLKGPVGIDQAQLVSDREMDYRAARDGYNPNR